MLSESLGPLYGLGVGLVTTTATATVCTGADATGGVAGGIWMILGCSIQLEVCLFCHCGLPSAASAHHLPCEQLLTGLEMQGGVRMGVLNQIWSPTQGQFFF